MTNYRPLSTQKKGLAAFILSSSICAGWLIADANQWFARAAVAPHQNTVIETVALYQGECR